MMRLRININICDDYECNTISERTVEQCSIERIGSCAQALAVAAHRGDGGVIGVRVRAGLRLLLLLRRTATLENRIELCVSNASLHLRAGDT